MTQQPESKLTQKIIEAIRKRGYWAMKKHGSAYSKGYPDVTACVGGEFLALEVKRPGKENTLTALQAHTLEAIRAAGGRAELVTSVEEVEGLMNEIQMAFDDDQAYPGTD